MTEDTVKRDERLMGEANAAADEAMRRDEGTPVDGFPGLREFQVHLTPEQSAAVTRWLLEPGPQ